MKNPFTPEQIKKIFHRSDDETIVNAGVEIVVGGCGHNRPKTVVVREPSNKTFRRHVGYFKTAFQDIADKHFPRMKEIWDSDDPMSAVQVHDLFKMKPVIDALTELIADVVDEPAKFVDDEMSPAQVAIVLQEYARVVGIKKIRDIFFQFRGAIAMETMDSTPPE